jgi:hypothetical protein
MIAIDELERNGEEADMTYFKVLLRHSPGGFKENH